MVGWHQDPVDIIYGKRPLAGPMPWPVIHVKLVHIPENISSCERVDCVVISCNPRILWNLFD